MSRRDVSWPGQVRIAFVSFAVEITRITLFLWPFFDYFLVDPNYGGFKPLPDGFKMPVAELLRGRQSYFKEGATMSRTYMTSVKTLVSEYYELKKDRRDLMKKGAVFFLITSLLDWAVCSL